MSSRHEITDPTQFHRWTRIEVRYSDLDTQGHVNNATYLTYFEQARAEFLFELHDRALAHQGKLRDTPAAEQGVPAIPFVVATASISYKRPIRGMAPVSVGIRCGSVGRASIEMHYAVRDEAHSQLYATGATTIVGVDLATGRPRALPAETRAALREMLAAGCQASA